MFNTKRYEPNGSRPLGYTIDGFFIPIVNPEPCYRLIQIGKGLPISCKCSKCTESSK